MAITMKDVAKEANVSLGTVSNYVNGKATVSENNRVQIEKAIQKLGYQLNEVARNLRANSSKTVGIIIPSFSNVFAVKIISELERKFREDNYSIYVLSYSYSKKALLGSIESLVSKRVDGLVVMPSQAMTKDEINNINKLIDQEIPVVVFDAFAQGLHCDHVLMDNYNAVKKAMDTLFENGHSKIALFLGPQDIHSSKERLSAYVDAYESRSLSIDPENIFYTDYSKTISKKLCSKMLDQRPGTTAIITTGFRITLGVLAGIYEKSKNIPDDISLIGFDIRDIADITPKPLVALFLPHQKIAIAVAEIILKRMKFNDTETPSVTEIEIDYVHGDSVRNISKEKIQ
ncbi:MAG: Transcriptional regulator, LacI family [Clostridiales bacterium 38_11]|nr:MAG: Transcriptional regulator, LacI family [Clostridiales bacterium 38_11]